MRDRRALAALLFAGVAAALYFSSLGGSGGMRGWFEPRSRTPDPPPTTTPAEGPASSELPTPPGSTAFGEEAQDRRPPTGRSAQAPTPSPTPSPPAEAAPRARSPLVRGQSGSQRIRGPIDLRHEPSWLAAWVVAHDEDDERVVTNWSPIHIEALEVEFVCGERREVVALSGALPPADPQTLRAAGAGCTRPRFVPVAYQGRSPTPAERARLERGARR